MGPVNEDAGGTFRVGQVECRRIPDGRVEYAAEDLFLDVSPDALRAAGIGATGLLVYSPLLIRTAGPLVLVDAGIGPELAKEWELPAGHAVDALSAASVSPEDIDVVAVSHGHPDHVGGLSGAAGGERVPTFPRARVVVSCMEWEFFTGPDGLAYDADDVEVFRTRLEPSREAGLLDIVDPGEEIAPGVRLVSAPGHTPGHCGVEIASEGERAVYIGDAMLHPVEVEHPEWTGTSDYDRSLTEATRRELLRLAAGDGRRWVTFHFDSIGTIERAGDGYRYVTD
jgi:glyoxylase-like metal-dependent hydrolase (beta-lactamase superfamily II)